MVRGDRRARARRRWGAGAPGGPSPPGGPTAAAGASSAHGVGRVACDWIGGLVYGDAGRGRGASKHSCLGCWWKFGDGWPDVEFGTYAHAFNEHQHKTHTQTQEFPSLIYLFTRMMT